jgi:GNAT superfamily N-acetyltransferase
MKYIKFFLHKLLGNYSFYRIYTVDLDNYKNPTSNNLIIGSVKNLEEFKRSSDPLIRDLFQYAGKETYAFGIWINGELASVCWYWFGNKYKGRNFWPLQADEAKLVQINTAQHFRGYGYASKLIAYSAYEMKKLGFRWLYARVWHSHKLSIRIFEKARWICIAYVIEIFLFGVKKLRFVYKI